MRYFNEAKPVLSLIIYIVIFISHTECRWSAGSSCPNIVSRAEWGAAAPKSTKRLAESPPPYVVIHHSDTPQCLTSAKCTSRVKNIQTYHMDHNNWEDIGYNFLIGGDGKIYEGRGWDKHGAHHPPYNSRSIGICLIGTYQTIEPPSVQMDALNDLLHCAYQTNKIKHDYKVIGHRQGRQTTCPGDKLFAEIKKLSNWEPDPV